MMNKFLDKIAPWIGLIGASFFFTLTLMAVVYGLIADVMVVL